jgi:hypothetical protein
MGSKPQITTGVLADNVVKSFFCLLDYPYLGLQMDISPLPSPAIKLLPPSSTLTRPPRTLLPRIFRLKYLSHLFRRFPGGLDKEEVDRSDLDVYPDDIHDVELPANSLETNADAIRIHHHCDIQKQEIKSGPFGAGAVLEALDCLESQQRCEAPRKNDAEEEDGDDNAVAEGGFGGCGGGEGG